MQHRPAADRSRWSRTSSSTLDWVGRLEEHGDARYVLLVDPATTAIEPVVAKLLLDPTPDLARVWQRAGFSALKLADIMVPPAARA